MKEFINHEDDRNEARKLPLKLRKNGFSYTQILCCGNYYIYEQDYNSGIEHNEPGITSVIKYYEVFRVKICPAKIINGKPYPEREVFPKNEDFGKTAFSFRDMGKAIDKLIEMRRHKK